MKKIDCDGDPTYYENMPQDFKDVLREFLEDFQDGWAIEELECKRRDGFFPHSYNKGGLRVKIFRDLAYWQCNSMPKSAQEVADKYIDMGMNDAQEAFKDKYANELSDLEVLNDECDYHSLYEKGLGELAERLSEIENEALSDDYASTYHTIMAMWNGYDELTLTLEHCVSDAPYHRKQDFQKEWVIKASNAKMLNFKLRAIKSEIEKVWCL